MKEKTLLMMPGPTPIPPSLLQAIAKPPIGHRSPEFSAIVRECYENLKYIFQTQNDVFIHTASGTGAMCSALENILNPEDRILCLSIGVFGERWAQIAKSRGACVEVLEAKFGEVIDPQELENYLSTHPPFKAITLTHSETSTGAANDIKTLCGIIKKHGALCIVDAITSLCAMPCYMDSWGIDVLVSSSQKGFMLPAGISFIAVSEAGMRAHEACLAPSFYFNWRAHKEALDNHTTPFTPAINLIIALRESLQMLKQEGLENLHAKHRRHALAIRESIRALGLKLLVEEDRNASFAATAILPPSGIEVREIRQILKEDYDIIVSNGQRALENRIFRIGTLGFISDRDILSMVSALEGTLLKLGYDFKIGVGLEAAIKRLEQS